MAPAGNGLWAPTMACCTAFNSANGNGFRLCPHGGDPEQPTGRRNYANNHVSFADGTPIISDVCVAFCDGAGNDRMIHSGRRIECRRTQLLRSGHNRLTRRRCSGNHSVHAGFLGSRFTATPQPIITKTGTARGSFSSPPVITTSARARRRRCRNQSHNRGKIGRLAPSRVAQRGGSTPTPSSGQITAWNGAAASTTAGYVYGGDLLGNLWRFDINAGTAHSCLPP